MPVHDDPSEVADNPDDPYKRSWESKSRISQSIWKYTGVVVTERPEQGSILSLKGVLITLIFLAILAGVVVVIIIASANAQPRAGDAPPADVVRDLAQAWDSRDCDAMKSATSAAFMDERGWSDCAQFETAKTLSEGDDFYPVGNMDITVEGRVATVWACDPVPAPEDWSCMLYELDYTGWAWEVASTRR